MADARNRQKLLPRCLGRLDRLVQFVLRRPQMLFRLHAMPGHIVVGL
jgi:hypothetical protein